MIHANSPIYALEFQNKQSKNQFLIHLVDYLLFDNFICMSKITHNIIILSTLNKRFKNSTINFILFLQI
jgi:hypothetical protein